jgi:O-antigen/teichoic acid export membrane protein
MILAVVTTGTVMLPHVANAFAKGENDKVRKYLYGSFSFVTFISMPMMFGLMAITSKFVPLFFTGRFISVVPIMIVESIVILPIAWGNVIGSQYLLPTKQNRSFTVSVVVGAVVNLIVNIPLIMTMGAVGTAIATVLSELSVTLYQFLSVRKQIEFKSLFSEFYKYLLAGIVMFIIVLYWDKLLSNSWISLFIEVLIGAVVYLIVLFLIRARILSKAKDIFSFRKRL